MTTRHPRPAPEPYRAGFLAALEHGVSPLVPGPVLAHPTVDRATWDPFAAVEIVAARMARCPGCGDATCPRPGLECGREPHPCGHTDRVRGCGGCDPGAIEYVRDDDDPAWRRVPDDDPCGGTGAVACWSPGGPCPPEQVATGCESCGPCLTCNPPPSDPGRTVDLQPGSEATP